MESFGGEILHKDVAWFMWEEKIYSSLLNQHLKTELTPFINCTELTFAHTFFISA